MYSLTFCVRVVSPKRHHWKPAVQAAAVMLRTPPPLPSTASYRPANHARFPHMAQFWEHLPSPVGHQPAACTHPAEHLHYVVISRDGQKLVTIGSCYVAIAMQPVHRLQICPIVHNQGAAPTTPPSYIRVRAIVWAYGRGQTDTQTCVTTIHFVSSTTRAKCKHFNPTGVI